MATGNAITVWGANYLLDVMFGRRSTPPTSYYVALLTQPPGDHTDGTLLSEPPSERGYARAQIANTEFAWEDATTASTSNLAGLAFPVATASWPVVTHYALCDSLVGGNVYLYGSFAVPRRISAGDQVIVPAGLLTLSVGSLTTPLISTF